MVLDSPGLEPVIQRAFVIHQALGMAKARLTKSVRADFIKPERADSSKIFPNEMIQARG